MKPTAKKEKAPAVSKGDPKSRIPHFKSIEEEAEFWDTHSTTTSEDEFEPIADVRFVVRRSPVTKALTVRIEEQTFARLAAQASQQGIGPSTLARTWILEHLRELEGGSPRRKSSGAAGR